MTPRLLGRAGLGLFTALAFTVAGCAETEADPTVDDPSLALASSADDLADTSFRFELEMGETMSATGAVDPAAGASTATLSVAGTPEIGMSLDMEILITDADMWVGLGPAGVLLGLEAPWIHLDLSRLGADGWMGFSPGQGDPAGAAALLRGLDGVEQVDERTYRGQVDLAQVDGSFADEYAEMLEGEAMTLTARLDDAGRLASLSAEIPSVQDLPAQTLEIRYFDYGTEVDVTPPPADQVAPAPDLIYSMIGA